MKLKKKRLIISVIITILFFVEMLMIGIGIYEHNNILEVIAVLLTLLTIQFLSILLILMIIEDVRMWINRPY